MDLHRDTFPWVCVPRRFSLLNPRPLRHLRIRQSAYFDGPNLVLVLCCPSYESLCGLPSSTARGTSVSKQLSPPGRLDTTMSLWWPWKHRPASALEAIVVISLPLRVLILFPHCPFSCGSSHPTSSICPNSTQHTSPWGHLAALQSRLLGLVPHFSQTHSSVSNWHFPFTHNVFIIFSTCHTHQQAGMYVSWGT